METPGDPCLGGDVSVSEDARDVFVIHDNENEKVKGPEGGSVTNRGRGPG